MNLHLLFTLHTNVISLMEPLSNLTSGSMQQRVFRGRGSLKLQLAGAPDKNNTSAYVEKISNQNDSKNGPGADVCLTEPDLRDASRGP